MNTPVAVPPSATQFVRGVGVVAQQVPRAVIVPSPSEVMFPPNVAPVVLMEAEVGVVTVGATGGVNRM